MAMMRAFKPQSRGDVDAHERSAFGYGAPVRLRRRREET